jgi:hypothetical protein
MALLVLLFDFLFLQDLKGVNFASVFLSGEDDLSIRTLSNH